MNFESLLLQRAVSEVSRLPGIGSRTALRLVLHLLRQDEAQVDALAESLIRVRKEIRYCVLALLTLALLSPRIV